MGSTSPVRRFDALRACVRCDLPAGRSRRGALPALSRPFRGIRRSPARFRRPVGRLVEPCFLSWAFGPYDTVSASRRVPTAVPPAAHRSRAGFGYPLRDLAESPAGARSAGASMGFPLQGVLPVAADAPLGAPALLALPAPAPHREVHANARPTSGLRSRHGFVRSPIPCGTGPSMPSWGSPLQSVLPTPPGARFGRAASPHTPLAG
jgi:hypothetical protein